MVSLLEALADIQSFVDKGGLILKWIAALTFIMWTLMFERLWFYKGALNGLVNASLHSWEARTERRSWNACQIRYVTVSRVTEIVIRANLDLLGTMVALCLLLGLLGTVTGMIEVFNVLAVTGGGRMLSPWPLAYRAQLSLLWQVWLQHYPVCLEQRSLIVSQNATIARRSFDDGSLFHH